MKKYIKKVRIISSNYFNYTKKDLLIGHEFELFFENYFDDTLAIKKDGATYYFNKSDTQELTPLSFNGKSIGIGDEVLCYGREWLKVYGYHWTNGEYVLETVTGNNDNFINLSINKIRDHRTPQTESDEIKKAYEVLKKAGKIKDGQIVKL